MLDPELALEAWKNAGSPNAPSVFLDRTTEATVEKWATPGRVAVAEAVLAIGLVGDAVADVAGAADDDAAGRSFRRESSCNRVLTTQMGFVAVAVTSPASAAALRWTKDVSLPPLNRSAMSVLPLP